MLTQVGIPQEYHCPGMQDEVVELWTDVADLLEKLGCEVRVHYSCSSHSVLLTYGEDWRNSMRHDSGSMRARCDRHLDSRSVRIHEISIFAGRRCEPAAHTIFATVLFGSKLL